MKYDIHGRKARKEGLSDYIFRAFNRAGNKTRVFQREPEAEEELVWG